MHTYAYLHAYIHTLSGAGSGRRHLKGPSSATLPALVRSVFSLRSRALCPKLAKVLAVLVIKFFIKNMRIVI